MRGYQRVEVQVVLLPTSDMIRTSVDINDEAGWTGIY